MMKNIKIILMLLFLTNFAVHAQKQVKGKVIDQKTNDPLIGVNIVVKGTDKGAATDFDGNYSIEVNNGDILEFKNIGFLNKTITVSETSNYNVAMEESAESLGEILLTSRKKAEYARDIPISITAIGGKELQKSGSFEFTDYASKVPNLSFGKQGGGGDLADGRTSNSITIRGITGNATTAFYLDEIPLPETIDPKLVDIKQVEVLRGPQGTLYGSSAMGGALKVLTNEPSTKSFYVNAGTEISSVKEGGANYGADVVFNVPLKEDKAALRLVGFYNSKSGIFDKTPSGYEPLNTNHAALTEVKEDVDDERSYGFHASLKLTPNDKWTVLPKLIYQKTEADGYNLADIKPGNFNTVRSADIDEDFEDSFTSTSLTVKHNTGKGEFVSATSYFDRFFSETEDMTEFLNVAFEFDPGVSYPQDITRTGNYSKFIQEIRYISDTESKINFAAGIFYANETLDELSVAASPGLGQFIDAAADENDTSFDDVYRATNESKISEFAVFTEWYFDITDKLKATAGVRYFNSVGERNRALTPSLVSGYSSVVGNLPEVKGNGFNPKFGLSYKINDNNMVYATVSKGFRLGGVNATLPSFSVDEANGIFGTTNIPQTYESDDLWSYELGGKLASNNRKFVLNTAVFYNNWNNLQLRSLLPASGYNFLTNVDGARSAGFELDATVYPLKGVTLGASFGYIDSKITDVGDNIFTDAKEGDEILLVPSVTAAGNAEYSWDAFGGSMFLRADVQHSGERYSSFDRAPERTLGAYTIMNTRLGIQLKKYDFSIFVNNLTNEAANFGDVISLAAEVPGRVRYANSRPTTIGASLRARF